MPECKIFYVTIAADQPRGAGYWEVYAPDRDAARAATFATLGYQWSMMYDSLDEVHEFDRKKHGRIG